MDKATLQSARARAAASEVLAPPPPPALAPTTALTPESANFAKTEATAAVDAVKELLDAAGQITALLGPVREALKTFTTLAEDITKIAAVASSGAAGRRWVPKAREAKADFIARATAAEPSFDFDVWANAHEAALRAEFPDSFSGKGWVKKKKQGDASQPEKAASEESATAEEADA